MVYKSRIYYAFGAMGVGDGCCISSVEGEHTYVFNIVGVIWTTCILSRLILRPTV